MHARQRGVAIITALLLTTLAITIVGSLFWQQQVQVRSIENQRLQLQKQWILRGALDWTRLILREDARISQTDNLDEPWAVPLAETRLDQYVENARTGNDVPSATLSGGIVDAESRFNLTNLCQGGQINPTEVDVFARLLSGQQQNPALAQATAELMAAAQGGSAANGGSTASDGTSTGTSTGTSAGTSGAAGVSDGSSRPLGILHVDDLLAVPGFTPAALAAIRDYIVVLPRVTPINVNTAPAEVLAARIDTLSLSDAAAIVAERKSAWFKDIADFQQRLGGKDLSSGQGEVAVNTSYFLVNGDVRLDRAGMTMQALIERSGLITRVVWIRED